MINPLSIALSARPYADFKSEADKKALEQALILNKLKASEEGRDLPAALQIAAALGQAQKTGDQTALNNIIMSGKLLDKGIFPEVGGVIPQGGDMAPQGVPVPFQGGEIPPQDMGALPPLPAYNPVVDDLAAMPTVTRAAGVQTIPGYDQALAGRAATVEGAKTQAQLQQELALKPKISEQTAAASKRGDEIGTTQNELVQAEANFPAMVDLTKKLSALGKISTYTVAGQARNELVRQLGYDPGDQAAARVGYLATVRNELLPLLRQTFGAQFTAAEGDKLETTLGDPNLSPREKDIALQAFIDSKVSAIASKRRQLGLPESDIKAPTLYEKSEQQFSNKKSAKDKVWTVTGDADYDLLPKGAKYKGPDGVVRVK